MLQIPMEPSSIAPQHRIFGRFFDYPRSQQGNLRSDPQLGFSGFRLGQTILFCFSGESAQAYSLIVRSFGQGCFFMLARWTLAGFLGWDKMWRLSAPNLEWMP